MLAWWSQDSRKPPMRASTPATTEHIPAVRFFFSRSRSSGVHVPDRTRARTSGSARASTQMPRSVQKAPKASSIILHILVRLNVAHQWRAANDARNETEAPSARPLNALCWASWRGFEKHRNQTHLAVSYPKVKAERLVCQGLRFRITTSMFNDGRLSVCADNLGAA